MVDLTMLAPGPAGTIIIGESNMEAAARHGLAKQRQRDKAMKFSNEFLRTIPTPTFPTRRYRHISFL